jgi:hypothetical protein
MVRFYPLGDGKEQLPYATGITDATGTYKLSHGNNEPGAVVGRNRVVVHWPSRDLRQAAAGEGAVLPPPTPPIPLRYTVLDDSPLTVDVKAGGRQSIPLVLEP